MSNNSVVIDIDDFSALCQQPTDHRLYPLADKIEKNVVIYSGDAMRSAITQDNTQTYLSELAAVLESGPGVFVIKAAFDNHLILEKMNQVFNTLLAQQKGEDSADHFATAGENGRVWNAFEKSARQNPECYINYYKNPVLQLAAQAWLGPHYQITAQLNVVYPGGGAQQPHRDYHLGFQDNREVARFPLHAQLMSRYLTLQGGIAHCDMPIISGPTAILPHSHKYTLGYQAWRDDAFKNYFAKHHIQLPLQQGDALFFNPALFHAAGNNNSESISRSVNLLQISSPFAKPMETVDRYQISQQIFPCLQQLYRQGSLDKVEISAILTASCDGYSFPSNLDTDPPSGAMAPQTQAQLTEQALEQDWSVERYNAALKSHHKKRQS